MSRISGNASGNDIATKGRFRYTGQAWIPELGMYYYKARIYSPTLGRFLQTDPIGYEDQFNLYAYVGNDPINGTDFTGRCETGKDCDNVELNVPSATDGEGMTFTASEDGTVTGAVDWETAGHKIKVEVKIDIGEKKAEVSGELGTEGTNVKDDVKADTDGNLEARGVVNSDDGRIETTLSTTEREVKVNAESRALTLGRDAYEGVRDEATESLNATAIVVTRFANWLKSKW